MAHPGLNKLEANEVTGAITLARLNSVADALGCELKYALIPREPLEMMVTKQARRRATEMLARINQSQALEGSQRCLQSVWLPSHAENAGGGKRASRRNPAYGV